MSVNLNQSAEPLTKTRQLGLFAASLTYAKLPPDVAHYCKRALVDWSAAAIAGAGQPAAIKVRQVIAALDQAGPATLIGTPLTANAAFAALGNAFASHLLDYDDVFNPIETTIHLSSCIWPAVLAIGQWRGLSGQAVIAAYVAGFETGARVARAAGATHYQSAWQVTGTMGHVAAAAAAANALGLSPAAAAHALGCSATQSAGIREVYGSDSKTLPPAKAAMDGVLSALLAEQGFTSTATAIEGERGLLRAVSQAPDDALLTEGLNTRWHLLDNGNKLYPTASLTHAAIEAAHAAAQDFADKRHEVADITVHMHPFSAAVTALVHPHTGPQARFSTPHCVAVTLARGGLGLGDFDDATLNDTLISQLRGRITIIADPSIDKRGCQLVLQWTNGEISRYDVWRNRGTPAVPLRDQDLSDKLTDACAGMMDAASAGALLEQCWTFEQVTDINLFMQRMRGTLAP